MSKTHGTFVWYDVMTNDTKAAESFYRSVIGWDAKDSGMTDRSYTLLSMGPTMIGGLMPIPKDASKAGVRPAWMGYIGVNDVDVYAKRVKATGGAIHRGPEDIPGVGCFVRRRRSARGGDGPRSTSHSLNRPTSKMMEKHHDLCRWICCGRPHRQSRNLQETYRSRCHRLQGARLAAKMHALRLPI